MPWHLCGACDCFKDSLTREDVDFIEMVVRKHTHAVIVESWIRGGNVYKTGKERRIDADKVRFVELARKTCYCLREKVVVSAVDVGCFNWQPESGSS